MSGTDPKLSDGNLPPEVVDSLHKKELYDEDEEDRGRDTWEDVCIMRLGPYTLEFDPYTRELTVTGGHPMNIDCLSDDVTVKEVEHCRTLILRPSE